MPLHSEILLDVSINAALASIEIYNKPDFRYREQTFSILNVNAWELLLKAKFLKDASEDLTCLYIPLSDGGYKLNRCSNPLTVDIITLLKKIDMGTPVRENISALVEIRDTVIHFYKDEALEFIIYSLGVASLKNYQRLIKNWFNRSLREYNFHIFPLAFTYDFRTLALLDLENRPEAIANIIKMVSESHERIELNDDFDFVCEVTTEIKSAKKFNDSPDFVTVIDTEMKPGDKVFIKNQNLVDKYPISFKELVIKVQKKRSEVSPNNIAWFIKKMNLKTDVRFSAFNFRNKQLETRYKSTGILPAGTPSIYNEDAVRFITDNLDIDIYRQELQGAKKEVNKRTLSN